MSSMKEKLKESFGYHKTGLRLLKITHVMDNSAIPLSIINSILDAVLPYIGFILSASIIDQLLNGEYRAAFMTAAVLVMTSLALGMINSVLKEILRFKRLSLLHNLPILMRKKCLELDYETMEKTEVKEKINRTEYTLRLNGGLDEVLDLYSQMFGAVLSVAAAFVMVVMLCLSRPKKDMGLIYHLGNPVLVSMIFVILIVAVVKVSMKTYARYAVKEQKIFDGHGDVEAKLSYLDSRVICNYSLGKVIRLFNMKDMIEENWREYMVKSRGFFNAMINVAGGQQLSQMWINSAYTVCSYIIVILKILSGAITVGSLTKYVGALVQFNASISTFITKSAEIRRCCGYMETLLEFMDLESGIHKGSIPVEKRLDNEYEIEFHDVSFSYPGNENKVLDHVSCHITMKDKMAVVGRNGAGKTTFIKLLCRLYEPTEGYITLNGVDIRKYDYDQYLKLFGVVFQDYSLFAFPIGENVASGRDYDKDRVWECLRQSGVAGRIEKMSERLNTPLFKYDDNGVEMSRGESQKVAIARALYKDAPFVILDEPTAALDPISEYEIYSRFDEMVKDKTSIYISHRMSSCRFCNDIIVFDNGRIVERGSHDKLLKRDGYYAALWNAQAQYYTA